MNELRSTIRFLKVSYLQNQMNRMNNIGILLIILNFSVLNTNWAQPVNDDCRKAIKIVDPTDYCSNNAEFTNVNATPSGYGPATCWGVVTNDVWFSFRATATHVVITIIGVNKPPSAAGGTLKRISGALYAGTCGGTIFQLACFTDVNNNGIISLSRGGLTVGEQYYIRVDGRNAETGSFKICTKNYFPPSKDEQDCRSATVLCNNNPFVNSTLSGPGVFKDEGAGSCLGEGQGLSEDQSSWYTWIAKSDCKLTFSLSPLNVGDDLDFALYELPSGIHNCNNKKLLRCSATHPTSFPPGQFCGYVTGLNLTSRDTSENLDCDNNEDGFVKYIDMKAGTAYSLIINNFSSTGIGFSIQWGDCEFEGPDAQFIARPDSGLRCETDFQLEDFSTFPVGQIDSFIWNFGVDASPPNAFTKGPHKVFYKSIGEKYITLTLVTNLGCRITKVKRIIAEPCCEDLPDIEIGIDSIIDVKCFGQSNGRVVFRGLNGNPYTEQGSGREYYTFSLDGIDFFDLTKFENLPAGDYTLYIQDRKGCTNSIQFSIKQPDPIIVNGGTDQNILLGDFIDVMGVAEPSDFYVYDWYFGDSLLCTNCQNPKFQPFKDGYYKVVATNSNDCKGIDSILIRVKREYNLWTPNVISSNGDGINDFFIVEGNAALISLDKIEIYDRWGGRVYGREKVPLTDFKRLWDGLVNGERVNPGVFVYRISARFIDGTVQEYGGDLTVLN
ncbi:MAG: hypothetical protein HOP11_15110 [Saprospiraceae bacterium]|nr:hypothetical protein [Saprospiraceae bacterium]